MRISVITPHYGPPWNEGVRNMARCLVEFLESKGEKVSIISPKLMREGGVLRTMILKVPLVQSLAFNVLAVGWAKQANPDVVLVLTSLSSLLGIKSWLLRTFIKKPSILYITGLRQLTLGYRFLLHAQKIIVNSDFLKAFFREAEVIPPFIETARFVRKDSVSCSKVVLFLGAFQRCRGVEYLIRAMAHLNGRVDTKLILAWNGKGSNRYHRILKTIEDSRIGDRVEVMQSADATSLYAQASVVVIPRITREKMAFPLRILEAFTVGVPLIVTRINQMDEIIDGCGLAVEPRDERALAAAMERLLTDSNLYLRCRDGCRKKAEEFSSEKSLEKLYADLRRCLEPVSKPI